MIKMNKDYVIFIVIAAAITMLLGCASRQTPIKSKAHEFPNTTRQQSPYLLQPGDQLEIKFFYNPELNETITVRPDGKISLQLVDDLQAAGLKPSQLDGLLTHKYSRELKKPMITVIVRSFTSQRIYVGGEVIRQGLIDLTAGMTPLQAVLNAGGFRETAKPKSAIVIRKGLDNRPVPIKMNLNDAMYGKSGSADFLLQPQDIVYVPKSTIAKLNKFVDQYIEGLLMFRGVSLGFSYELHADYPEYNN